MLFVKVLKKYIAALIYKVLLNRGHPFTLQQKMKTLPRPLVYLGVGLEKF